MTEALMLKLYPMNSATAIFVRWVLLLRLLPKLHTWRVIHGHYWVTLIYQAVLEHVFWY